MSRPASISLIVWFMELLNDRLVERYTILTTHTHGAINLYLVITGARLDHVQCKLERKSQLMPMQITPALTLPNGGTSDLAAKSPPRFTNLRTHTARRQTP
jgi:hypothetical protein